MTAVLLLAACGGGNEASGDSDKLAAADTGGSPSASSPSAAAGEPADRPDITLPQDVKDVFEKWETGDAAKDAVLSDAAQAQTAMNDSILQGRTDTEGLTFYYDGEALTTSVKWVRKWLDAGITYTGTTRYFSPKVELLDAKSAGVSFCADETKALNKDRKTGKIDKSPATSDSYVLFSTRLEKNDRGVWRTTDGTSVREARHACNEEAPARAGGNGADRYVDRV